MIRHWFWPVFSMELRKVFAYRVDFWFNFFAGTGIFFAISYLLWNSVFEFSGAQVLGGYTQSRMIFYFFLVPFFDRVVRSHESFSLSLEIYEGGLTKYLLYPLSVLGFKYVGQLAYGFIGYVQFWIVFGIYLLFFSIPDGVTINFNNAMMALSALVIANALNFLILNTVEMGAFWVDNVWSLSVMARYLISAFSGYLIPLSLYPEWTQPLFKILPFGYTIGFPIQLMMGELSFYEYLMGMGVLSFWLVLFAALGTLIWKRGIVRYAGVGI